MATTIKLKNGSGAPLASALIQGEPAFDLTNKRLYTEDSGGTVIEIGTNPSTFAGATIADLGTVTTADINGGTIDGTIVGGASAAAGTFTNLTATGTVTFADNSISGDDIDGGTISNFASTGIDDNATATAVTITDSGIAATLTTAAQPNITSVGTLTGFTSTGIDDNATSTTITIDSSDNVTVANKLTITKSATAGTQTANATGSTTLDFATYQNFVLTLTGNVTLANPTTEAVGQSGFIVMVQDATGGRTVSLGTDYETAGGAGLTVSSAASTTDIVPYVVTASGRILLGAPQLAFS